MHSDDSDDPLPQTRGSHVKTMCHDAALDAACDV
jgi:hypothetical protein